MKLNSKYYFTYFTILIGLLLITSILFVYSASSVFALERHATPHYYLYHHCMGIILGTITLLILRYIPLLSIRLCTPFLFFISLFLITLTIYTRLGITIHGSHRWLKIYGFSFQPSELLKISFLLYIAHFFSKKQYITFSFWNTYFPFVCIMAIVNFLLLQQPDFGLAITLSLVALLIFFFTQKDLLYVTITLSASLIGSIILIFIKPYRMARIMVFLNPWKDPQGSGFQIIQSLIAIGAGHWWGLGISHSKQKFFYLPMQHTDFIFSIIAEEIGFFGSCLIITLFLGILYTGICMALHIQDMYCQLTVLGFVLLISIQAGINIAMASGLLPTKGIGLPYVSYGNTSLICNIAMIGLIGNMIHNQADY